MTRDQYEQLTRRDHAFDGEHHTRLTESQVQSRLRAWDRREADRLGAGIARAETTGRIQR